MRRRHALSIAVAAVLGALAIVALPALAGAKDDHHRGHDRNGERHHHHRHGGRDHNENVGRISAFDSAGGELTIARFGGGTISGLVTGSTEIKCEGRDDNARLSRDHGGNSGPGSGSGDDNGGRGESEPGDDHGGQGEEKPGDDHGERVCTTADLTVGTVVHEIDRRSSNGVATFDEIELGHQS
ncbi:MAG TPA: hypothetical protein VGI73_07715 [Solirubrobacterales bacterium]|jgi:hypothetical protein